MQATPDDIKLARIAAGLTQPQAAELVAVHPMNWSKYERGVQHMAPSMYELFLIKTGQHPEFIRIERHARD